jgi:hypothetical protein
MGLENETPQQAPTGWRRALGLLCVIGMPVCSVALTEFGQFMEVRLAGGAHLPKNSCQQACVETDCFFLAMAPARTFRWQVLLRSKCFSAACVQGHTTRAT